jgi:hypothetical protein
MTRQHLHQSNCRDELLSYDAKAAAAAHLPPLVLASLEFWRPFGNFGPATRQDVHYNDMIVINGFENRK